ncbi:TonB-dependent receptor [Phenylobacterium sp.]|uniref:TonB-dependent receptor n=1 Tax=Phenylobacterium sp. TaxID=1871053 RepID=UPI002FC6D90A
MAGVSAALIAPAAFAAEGIPPAGHTIEEIVVTAQKREEGLNSVPMSVSAATGEQLARKGVDEPRDLVKIVPGLTYADSYTASPIYTLRGIGFSDTSLGGRPTVSMYVDEAPLPFPVETRGANLDLERVEVLKGPQGTLFGQNATGGAINFVAAKPTETFAAGVDASYGRFNAVDLSGFISGPIAETLRARVALQTTQRDGWQKSYTHGGTLGREDFINGRLLLEWTPTDALTAQLNLNGWIDDSDTQAPQVTAITPSIPPLAAFVPAMLAYPLSPRTSRAADWDPAANYDRNHKFYQANLRLDYKLPYDLTLTSITSYNHFTGRQPIEVDGTPLHNIEQVTYGRISGVSEEIRLAGELAGRGHFVVGASAAYDKVFQNDDTDLSYSTIAYSLTPFGLPVFTGYNAISRQRAQTQAVFASVDYDLTETVSISGGARYTKSDNKFEGCTADRGDGNTQAVFGNFWNFLRSTQGLPPNPPIPPGGCGTANAQFVPGMIHNKLNEDNVSWRAGAEWKPQEGALVYANLSKGYKAGGFPILGATRNPQFDPARQESVLAYEVGFKTALLSRTLQLNGAAFYYDYQDKQILGRVLDQNLGPLLALVNVPKSDIRGAELQATWSPMHGLTISTGVSYINSRILGGFVNYDPDAVLANFDDEAFPNTPKWQILSDVNYVWSINDQLNGVVGGGVTYQTRSNSQLGELPSLATKAYALIDLRVGVETVDGRWRVSAWGRNVGDTYYWSAANRNIDVTVRFAGMPATYGISLSRRFE